MDILSIQPETISVDIKHPATGALIGLSVQCVSLEDDRVKAVERTIKNRALRSGRNSVTAEKIEDNTIEILSAAVVGWTWAEGLTLGDLKNPPLNKPNVVKVLAVSWIAKQIDSALGDEAAFFRAVGDELAEVVRLFVRYDTRDQTGETRRERNERFGVESPDIEVEPDYAYLLEWFWDLHSSRANGFDGPNPITITDIANWSALTGTILRREEVAILRQIDVSYIVAIGQEHAEEAARAKDKTK